MNDVFLQLGVGGLLVILVLKEVFAFLKNVKEKRNGGYSPACAKCFEMVRDLYDMHNQKDSDGVYIWYVRRSLEDAVNKLAENIAKQTDCFKELVMRLKEKVN